MREGEVLVVVELLLMNGCGLICVALRVISCIFACPYDGPTDVSSAALLIWCSRG